jgi:hypothetical protein|tara:strand:- start:853 stop:1038 length:186 start_codon:yes stop_codon:yes gene_type:complete
MIIVKDIQDAITMKVSLKSIQRRANTFAKSKEDILLEIGMLIEDLDKNIEREESALFGESG